MDAAPDIEDPKHDFSRDMLQEVLRYLGIDVEITLHRRENGGIGTLRRTSAVTDEVLDAARRGDRLLLAALLAERVEPDDDETAALRELDESPELQETIPLETVRAKYAI